MAWFGDQVVRVNGPLPQSVPRAKMEFGTPHRTPPSFPTQACDRMDPTVEARIGRKAEYKRRRWKKTVYFPVCSTLELLTAQAVETSSAHVSHDGSRGTEEL